MRAFVESLGSINAGFNALSALLLVTGLWAIRSGRRGLHRACMLSALAASALFLAGYLTRAALGGTRRFPVPGAWHAIYLTILLPHMLLAITVAPLALWALSHALQGRFERHRAIARVAFPIWLFVSVTGVVVYLMLYHFPARWS